MKENQIVLKAHSFDMDWNRHVTSRTYEKFSQEARYLLLEENGFPLKKCIEKNLVLTPISTEVKFLNQQFAGNLITVDTKAIQVSKGVVLWKHRLTGDNGKPCCELDLVTEFSDQNGNLISISDSFFYSEISNKILPFSQNCSRLTHQFHTLYSDLNFLIKYSPDAIWKIFEEGRWLFFTEIFDIESLKDTDTTSFFMGGQIQFYRLPKPGEKVRLQTWIEQIEKIRFYFRQDLESESGEIICSMRDEQLFVSLKASKPKKAPMEFINTTKKYIEHFK